MDRALKSALDWWDAAGVDVPNITLSAAPKKRALPKTRTTERPKPKAPAAITKPASQPILDAAPIAKAAKTLTDLKSAMDKFDAGLLSDQARQCVFARGNPESSLMVIGEAPSREEDIAGKPFVGQTGQLMGRMLASIGLGEDDYYITNVVNWRTPKGRNPSPEEIEICRPFLNRHIELVAPKVILIVGGVSLSAITGISGIMKNRGQWQTFKIAGSETGEIPAMPIYHPAFLLRQPELKKDAWRDLLALRQRLLA